MKKILLTAVCAAALATPALAGGRGGNDDGSRIEQSIKIDQIGMNNGALAIQNGAADDLDIAPNAFEDVETGLDLGDLRYQNNNWIVGGGSIDRVQNINDDIEGDAINGDEIDLEDVVVAFQGANVAAQGGTLEATEIEVEIDDVNVAVGEDDAILVNDLEVDLGGLLDGPAP